MQAAGRVDRGHGVALSVEREPAAPLCGNARSRQYHDIGARANDPAISRIRSVAVGSGTDIDRIAGHRDRSQTWGGDRHGALAAHRIDELLPQHWRPTA